MDTQEFESRCSDRQNRGVEFLCGHYDHAMARVEEKLYLNISFERGLTPLHYQVKEPNA